MVLAASTRGLNGFFPAAQGGRGSAERKAPLLLSESTGLLLSQSALAVEVASQRSLELSEPRTGGVVKGNFLLR